MMCKANIFFCELEFNYLLFFKPNNTNLENSRSVQIKVACSSMYVKKILMCEFSSSSLFLILKHFYLLYFPPTNAMYSNLNSTKTIEQISLLQFFFVYIYRSVTCSR